MKDLKGSKITTEYKVLNKGVTQISCHGTFISLGPPRLPGDGVPDATESGEMSILPERNWYGNLPKPLASPYIASVGTRRWGTDSAYRTSGIAAQDVGKGRPARCVVVSGAMSAITVVRDIDTTTGSTARRGCRRPDKPAVNILSPPE